MDQKDSVSSNIGETTKRQDTQLRKRAPWVSWALALVRCCDAEAAQVSLGYLDAEHDHKI